MSRSKRYPFYYNCYGAKPSQGKFFTNCRIRAKQRNMLHKMMMEDLDDFYIGNQDKVRGYKGSREVDWGWKFFGDGAPNSKYSKPNQSFIKKLKRK